MALDEEFNKAAEEVKNLKVRPTDEELLQLYGLFKQGSIGDCNTAQPGLFHIKDRAKWDFWNKRKGMSQDAAKQEYITFAKSLVDKYQSK